MSPAEAGRNAFGAPELFASGHSRVLPAGAATAPGATLPSPVHAVVTAVGAMPGGVARAVLADTGVAVTHSSALRPGVHMPEATLTPEQMGRRHGGGGGGGGGPKEITTRVPGVSGGVSQASWALPPGVVGLAVVRRRRARARAYG
jgi:hypothetical protein